MAKAQKETPLMTQYNSIKARYPDAMLLFRVGDFYETFGQDAIKASKILGITLTKRANGAASSIELAGFPYHSLETYLPKLVKAGLRVAICDQLEDPKTVKGIVKRGVTELITPGVSYNDQVLNAKQNNYLMAIHQDKGMYGVAFVDVSTGEFWVSEGNLQHFLHLLSSFDPSEILYQRGTSLPDQLQKRNLFKLDDWAFGSNYGYQKINQHFNTHSLKGFGIENMQLAQVAAGAIFAYLVEDTHHNLLAHISKIQAVPKEAFMRLDEFSLRNLEIIYPSHKSGKSLLDIIDKSITPMGGRLIRRWLYLPLKNLDDILRRQNLLAYLLKDPDLRYHISQQLRLISDTDRLVGKLASEKINPKELGYLRQSLLAMQEIKNLLKAHPETLAYLDPLQDLSSLNILLDERLNAELPANLAKGQVIKTGVHEELDHLRGLQSKGKGFLEDMRLREIEITGISSLKIDFNNVFGYYIEVKNTHKDKVPEAWIRKQTLVNCERYITPELKDYEEQILGAEDKISIIEATCYRQLCQEILLQIDWLQDNTKLIAQLDVCLGLAQLAEEEKYCQPTLNESYVIDIKAGRHPIIEKSLPLGETYIPNDIYLDRDQQQIIMLTGPNMAGKSAVLRQTAIIALMAQMGSFVPAQSCTLGLLDQIFTRVGASDNISAGESTFMVEMNEAANILNNLSDRSLILLDEIGRGTSTYDGVSIAWAIAEYLHEHFSQAKCLFATHYHELNDMSEDFERIKNFHVSIKEHQGQIIFMRTLKEGGSEHSFGIHVAKLAGMPKPILDRAEKILAQLEKNHQRKDNSKNIKKLKQEDMQLSFFQLDDPLLESIRDEILSTDVNSLTPIEALIKLNSIKKMLGK